MRGIVIVLLLLLASLAGGIVGAQDTQLTLLGPELSGADDVALGEAVEAFMAANPGVSVDVVLVPDHENVVELAENSGSLPDVLYVRAERLPEWAQRGLLQPGNRLIEGQDAMDPLLRAAFTYEGDLYCPPYNFSTLALYYNVDLFDEIGIDPPTDNWDWDSLFFTGEDLNALGVLGLVSEPRMQYWLPFLYQADGDVLGPDGQTVLFEGSASFEALEFYVDMLHAGAAGPPSEVGARSAVEAFVDGSAAMLIEGNAVIPRLDAAGINWDVAVLPAHFSGEQGTVAFAGCYGVSSNSRNADAAWALVNFLSGPQAMRIAAAEGTALAPALPDVAGAWAAERDEAFIAGLDHARVWRFPVGFEDFVDVFNEGFSLLLQGEATVDDVISETSRVIDGLDLG